MAEDWSPAQWSVTPEEPHREIRPEDITIIPRSAWEKYKPQFNMDQELMPFQVPATRVRLSRSKGKPCQGLEDCVKRLQWMQWNHMYHWGLQDIAFNFLVSTDGTIYEGRGWTHTPQRIDSLKDKVEGSYLDIGFIGDYKRVLAPLAMEQAATSLIKKFVSEGKVVPDYTLLRFKLSTKFQLHFKEVEKARKKAERQAEKAKRPKYNKYTKKCYKMGIPQVYCPTPEKMRKINKHLARQRMEDEYTNNYYKYDKEKLKKNKAQKKPAAEDYTVNELDEPFSTTPTK